MTTSINFDEIAAASTQRLEELVTEWFPAGRREGREFKVGGLTGEPGRSLSINLATGVWKDFSSDEGGANAITLYAAIHGIKNGEAAKRIADRLGCTSAVSVSAPAPRQASDWEPLEAAPKGQYPPNLDHFKFGTPSHKYEYWDADGEHLHGIVCRWDLPEGKQILPISYCQKDGKFDWKWKAFAKPRPLFGLAELASKPTAKVLIVEGEKTALAARELFPKLAVVSWAGGAKAIKYTDWMPLAERTVFLWPDNDEPGVSAMQAIAAILSDAAAQLFMVKNPDGKPEGWDLADAKDEGISALDLIPLMSGAGRFLPTTSTEHDIPAENREEPEGIGSAPYVPDESDYEGEPFRILGHADGMYYYLRKSTQTIHALTPSGHSKLELIAVAPAHYWEQTYPSKQGADWFAAANSLIQRASQIDFSPNMIRGRGAWLDDGRVVFHAGKNLFVDQNEIGLDTFSSEFTYKKGQKLEADIIKPLSSQESSKIVSLLECIQFRNKLDSKLFAGWLALAPICGALEWRPHLWLTGPSGSGKSWVLSHIVRPVLGNCALYFQSVSTSAGIRQSLGCDALPVIFDEAEVEREADQKRMQEVIILARQASRESDGRIVKGTAGGAALTWHVRSCFLFASIGLGATQRADLSRITCLDLLPENQRREDRFSEAQVLQKETVRQKEWASAFRARSVSLAGVIAQNAELFKNAVLDHLGNQRDADQFGSLLAGAYSLHSTKVITQDKANEWCAAQDWSAFLSNESEKDEHKCLAVLLEANIMVNTLGAAPERVAVMELISRALEHNWFSDVAKTSRGVLERFGICVRREGVDIASAHEELAKIYRQTQFVGKWNEFLARIPGAKRIDSSKIMNISKRAVRLPLAMFAVVPED